jgi:hypothetical protein
VTSGESVTGILEIEEIMTTDTNVVIRFPTAETEHLTPVKVIHEERAGLVQEIGIETLLGESMRDEHL